MLGWMVSVYRIDDVDRRPVPAEANTARGDRLAQWQGGVGALKWIRELCDTGDAVALGGSGYPTLFTARCGALRPVIESGPPHAHDPWVAGPSDRVDSDVWEGATSVSDQLSACSENEWLLVEAWDES